MQDKVVSLSVGSNNIITRYDGYLNNGCRSHIRGMKLIERQSSGVIMCFQSQIYFTIRDLTPMSEMVEYYGVIEEIIELDY